MVGISLFFILFHVGLLVQSSAKMFEMKFKSKLLAVLKPNKFALPLIVSDTSLRPSSTNKFIVIRGGKSNNKKEINSNLMENQYVKQFTRFVSDVKPVTRAYLSLVLFCTLVQLVGLPAPAMFSLSTTRWYEFWRPLTASAYFGAPGLSMLNSLYFLSRYGQTLESINGGGEFAWFLLVQVATLAALSLPLGFPFTGHSVIAAIVYIISRLDPFEKMGFQFGMVITSWQLPFYLMAMDCLSQQSVGAAWPHVLGILSGHTYHFLRDVWPSLGGANFVAPPQFLLRRLGSRPANAFQTSESDPKTDAVKKKPTRRAAKGRRLDEPEEVHNQNS